MSDRWIVVTSINQPTVAVRAFGKLVEKGWRVVVVGDTKTPADWACEGVDFLSMAAQLEQFSPLAELIPVRHYCRKNLGYLYAMRQGAKMIVDTDDDNIPYEQFGLNISEHVDGRLLRGITASGEAGGWVNIYRHFTEFKGIWPRGLPLDEIQSEGVIDGEYSGRCLVQQFLADEDPDVDAIYRLTGGPLVTFESKAKPVVLAGAGKAAQGAWVPFNSQNTVFFEEAFGLMYLPCFVSFRMTDIWRSFVAQVALWAAGETLSFHAATVKQVRNVHRLMRDFEDEIPGYLHNRRIMETLVDAAERLGRGAQGMPLGEIAGRLWQALLIAGILEPREEKILQAWGQAVGG